MNLKELLLVLLSLSSCSYIKQTDNKVPEQKETPIILTFEERLDLSEQIFDLTKSKGYRIVTSATNDGILIKSYDDLAQVKNKSIALLDVYNLIAKNMNKPVRLFKSYAPDHALGDIHNEPYMYYFYWGANQDYPYLANNSTMSSTKGVNPTMTLRYDIKNLNAHGQAVGLFGEMQYSLAELSIPLAAEQFHKIGIIAIPDRETGNYDLKLYSKNNLLRNKECAKALEKIRLQIQNIYLRKVDIKHKENIDKTHDKKDVKHEYEFVVLDETVSFQK